MRENFSRTELLLGREAMEKLSGSRVAVFGLGGVGGHAAEALARSGVGTLDIFDHDTISRSNINRQTLASELTIGCRKVDVMRERILSVNPQAVVHVHDCFYMPDTADDYDLAVYDYIIDAVDTVTAKLELIVRAQKAQVPIISCMGTGNKLDPTRFEIADIYKTSVCPLAKVMRRELKARGIRKCKVLYSREEPVSVHENEGFAEELKGSGRRSIPGSVSFVPPVAGLIIAGEVIRDLIAQQKQCLQTEIVINEF